MRNRRFQNAVAQEMMSLNGRLGGYYPQQQATMMRGMPMDMPVGPAPPPPAMFDYEVARDELATIDQELNLTRRTTKPFVPTNAPNYWSLQRQVQDMEQPIPQAKPAKVELTSVDQLPKPAVKAPLTQAALPKSCNRPEVRIADQIAIRSFVLGSKLPKTGKASAE
jgi:hypothetical protein